MSAVEMGSAFRIRDIVAEAGSKEQGYLTIGEGPIELIQVPLVIVRGAQAGPTLCITAGVHAAEYSAIDAVIRTMVDLDPAVLSGTVIAVPVINTPMFLARAAFISPIDGLNLNRTFLGKP